MGSLLVSFRLILRPAAVTRLSSSLIASFDSDFPLSKKDIEPRFPALKSQEDIFYCTSIPIISPKISDDVSARMAVLNAHLSEREIVMKISISEPSYFLGNRMVGISFYNKCALSDSANSIASAHFKVLPLSNSYLIARINTAENMTNKGYGLLLQMVTACFALQLGVPVKSIRGSYTLDGQRCFGAYPADAKDRFDLMNQKVSLRIFDPALKSISPSKGRQAIILFGPGGAGGMSGP